MSFINWDDIDLQGKSSGTKKTTCPACSEERKKKTDKCLSVDVSTGLAFCHHCEAK
jgi:twinkle protein